MSRHALRMNVGQLRRLIEGLPDDVVVLRPASDHSYAKADGAIETAGHMKREGLFFEWHGPEHANPGEVPVQALVIS